MLSVAMRSRWHVHANDYANQAKKHPELEIKWVWDEEPARGQQWAEELDVQFAGDLDKLLSNPNLDAVIVDTPTNLHPEVISKAANQGKHIFSEKVLAFTVAE